MVSEMNDLPASVRVSLPKLKVATVILDSAAANVYLTPEPSEAPHGGKLALLGGTVEHTDQTLARAAKRVIRQKTGEELQVTQFLTWFHSEEYVLAVFAARSPSTKVDTQLEGPAGQLHSWGSLSVQNTVDRLAPHVYDACQKARKWNEAFTLGNVLRRIPEALKAVRTALLRNFRDSGKSGGGWNILLDKIEPGIVATAYGLRTLLITGYPALSKEIRMARDFLKATQGKDGGWSTLALHKIKRDNPISISESTSLALLGLLEAGEDAAEKCIGDGFDWLRKNKCRDGGWNLTGGFDRSRVLPTTLALEAFHLVGDSGKEYQDGLAWLANAQHKTGMWDVFSFRDVRDQDGSPTHAAIALISLSHDRHTYSQQIEAGTKWLILQYKESLGLNCWSGKTELEFLEEQGLIGINWVHFAAPWCLQGLITNGVWLEEEAVCNTLQSILESQNFEGVWKVPGVLGIRTWAQYDFASALQLVSSESIYHLETPTALAAVNQASQSLDRLAMHLNSLRQSFGPKRPLRRGGFPWILSRLKGWGGWTLFVIVALWGLGVWKRLWNLGSLSAKDNLWVQILVGVLVAVITALFLKMRRHLRKLFKGE